MAATRRPRRGRAIAPIAALVAASLGGGCDSGGTECTCPPTGLMVNLPSALGGEVQSITPSGPACASASVDPDPASVRYANLFRIEPTETGSCQLTIDFSDGTTFSDTVTVVETTGCCAGLRTSPASAAQIDVPAPGDGGA